VQAQFMHSKTFSSAVGKVLSTFRGEMQRKVGFFTQLLASLPELLLIFLQIQRSIIDKEDVATLASRLAVHGFRVGNDHILRIAFLVSRSSFPPYTQPGTLINVCAQQIAHVLHGLQ
jgi:hypothetical protein